MLGNGGAAGGSGGEEESQPRLSVSGRERVMPGSERKQITCGGREYTRRPMTRPFTVHYCEEVGVRA